MVELMSESLIKKACAEAEAAGLKLVIDTADAAGLEPVIDTADAAGFEPVIKAADAAGFEPVIEAAEAAKTGRLCLTDGNLMLCGDFTANLPRLKHNNLTQELLVKAAKIKNADHPLTAFDATAGMGEDSLLLAAAGFHVKLFEYDAVIAALLRDTLHRASFVPELAEIAARMELIEGDSISMMPQLAAEYGAPDVILLDPMFPAREKSALIKKKFQLLQRLEQPCTEEADLLAAALAAHPHKIVIKRPLKGPLLAGHKPSYSLKGKAIRYDCIVIA